MLSSLYPIPLLGVVGWYLYGDFWGGALIGAVIYGVFLRPRKATRPAYGHGPDPGPDAVASFTAQHATTPTAPGRTVAAILADLEAMTGLASVQSDCRRNHRGRAGIPRQRGCWPAPYRPVSAHVF